MKMKLYGEVLEYGYGIEVYRDIKAGYLSMIQALNTTRQDYKKADNVSFEKYFDVITKVRNNMIGIAVEYAVGLLYKNGLEFANEEDFYDKYSSEFECFFDDISPLLEKCSELENQYQMGKDALRLKKMGRSYWTGGGFGVKGAIKGAVTAKVMNVGMDLFRDAADSGTERKISNEFAQKKRAILQSQETVDIIFDSIGREINKIADCVMLELVDEEIVPPFRLETSKARALINNTLRYNTMISDEKLHEVTVRALQMDPFCKEVYETMFQFDSEDKELIEFALYFNMLPQKLIEDEKEICLAMNEDSWEDIVEKVRALQEVCDKYGMNADEVEIERLLSKLQKWYISSDEILENVYSYIQKNFYNKTYQGVSDLECYRIFSRFAKGGDINNRKIVEVMKGYSEVYRKYGKNIRKFAWMTMDYINPRVAEGDMPLADVVIK